MYAAKRAAHRDGREDERRMLSFESTTLLVLLAGKSGISSSGQKTSRRCDTVVSICYIFNHFYSLSDSLSHNRTCIHRIPTTPSWIWLKTPG